MQVDVEIYWPETEEEVVVALWLRDPRVGEVIRLRTRVDSDHVVQAAREALFLGIQWRHCGWIAVVGATAYFEWEEWSATPTGQFG